MKTFDTPLKPLNVIVQAVGRIICHVVRCFNARKPERLSSIHSKFFKIRFICHLDGNLTPLPLVKDECGVLISFCFSM